MKQSANYIHRINKQIASSHRLFYNP